MLASGCTGQYLINQYVLRLEGHSLDRHLLDSFASTIQWPKKAAKLPDGYFTNRVQNNEVAHVKGFAAETICAIIVCVFFGELC